MKSGAACTPAGKIGCVCRRSDVRRDFPFRDAHFSKVAVITARYGKDGIYEGGVK